MFSQFGKIQNRQSLNNRYFINTMTTQINYYELDKLDASSFTDLFKQSVNQVKTLSEQTNEECSLEEFAVAVFNDETLSKFMLLLARLPVFSSDFEVLLKDNLEALSILKKLKYFANLKIRETLYLLVKLLTVSEDINAGSHCDVAKFFLPSEDSKVEELLDTKFKSALNQDTVLFASNKDKKAMYNKEFDTLEVIEPHAIFPTSIYRQSDGCTVATEDSQTIEAVMSTTLTTSIRIQTHVLEFGNTLISEIYQPYGRAVIVLDDKLEDKEYTNGLVDRKTNRRAVLDMHKDKLAEYVNMTVGEQIHAYFAHHNIETKVLVKSGDEVDKDIEKVEDILVELKKLGCMRNEPILIVGGGVICDIAGFACALFHRGTPYVQLNTSIVSGIDAGPSPRVCSDGQGFKNAFGAFHPPVMTLTDRTLWTTMHVGLIRHGIAEMVKMAAVENRPLFELLESVNPAMLVKTKFGTDLSGIDASKIDIEKFDADCERLVGMAMESYVRAEYGNLWETHQRRPHAYGHTWSPGYELPAGLLHGHAIATCMGFGAYLSYKHCGWITEAEFIRICKLMNDLELSLWADIMDDKEIFHSCTKKMVQKRGGNLAAPIPRYTIGQCGYLNEISDAELSRYVDEYKQLVTKDLGFARNGYGVEPFLADVGLAETTHDAMAHVRGEIAHDKKDEAVQKAVGEKSSSYNEWIKAVQTDRNSEWKFNVMFDKAPDTEKAPSFPQNTLFHEEAEEYAMTVTSTASSNVQTAARITEEEKLFAPCMVGTLESQFLKMFTKTMKAQRILDVGTFTGMSAIAFAEGALSGGVKEPIVHTLEFDEPTAKAAGKIFSQCDEGVKNAVKLHRCSAGDWMKALAEDPKGMSFDIIFIDADKDNYIEYYELAMGSKGRRALLAEGGVILADNSLSALVYDEDDDRRVALHQFNQMVKNDDRVEQVVLTVREGISMISRK